jgi:choline dehydrogenase
VVSLQYRLRDVVSINEMSRGWRLVREAIRYARTRKGLLALSAAHVQAYVSTRPGLSGPDVQFHILPATVDVPRFVAKQEWELERLPGLTLAACQLRPESRGTIHIRSNDPFAPPAIRPNYLADPLDQRTIVAGLEWGRRIATQPALEPFVANEILPGSAAATEEDLLAYARTSGSTIYHPVGTARMGRADDACAVVDSALRVFGVQGLRVVDASVMPRLVSGNTNAPTIMIAEKAADMIRA